MTSKDEQIKELVRACNSFVACLNEWFDGRDGEWTCDNPDVWDEELLLAGKEAINAVESTKA